MLQQRSPRHLTIGLLHAFEALLRAVAPAEALHTAVLQRLLLNLRLWAAAPLPIQRNFQTLLLKLAKACCQASSMRYLALADVAQQGCIAAGLSIHVMSKCLFE